MEVGEYVVTDTFFGPPDVDMDEERAEPIPHRRVHGGFENTDTRFTFYFPTAWGYEGRMFQPIEGGAGGHEAAHAVHPQRGCAGVRDLAECPDRVRKRQVLLARALSP
jgi:hypothetical protein